MVKFGKLLTETWSEQLKQKGGYISGVQGVLLESCQGAELDFLGCWNPELGYSRSETDRPAVLTRLHSPGQSLVGPAQVR